MKRYSDSIDTLIIEWVRSFIHSLLELNVEYKGRKIVWASINKSWSELKRVSCERNVIMDEGKAEKINCFGNKRQTKSSNFNDEKSFLNAFKTRKNNIFHLLSALHRHSSKCNCFHLPVQNYFWSRIVSYKLDKTSLRIQHGFAAAIIRAEVSSHNAWEINGWKVFGNLWVSQVHKWHTNLKQCRAAAVTDDKA